MEKENKKDKRKHNEYRVVALYAEPPGEDPLIFVSQSKMLDIKKLFSYYKRECKFTKEFFEQDITPALFLLEDEWLSKAGAYLHRIAWIRYFLDKDYDVVGDLKSHEEALDLYGVAAVIYQTLSKIPLEEVMQRRHTHTPETLGKKQEQKGSPIKKPGPLTQRLSIRLSGLEHRAFSEYCDKHGLTQREGLQMLLSGTSNDGKYERTLVMEQNYRIKQMEEVIAGLQKVPRSIPEYENLKEAFRFAKQGMLQYIDMQAEKPSIMDRQMKCVRWHEMNSIFPQYREYEYPQKDGYFIFKLEMMAYGGGTYSAIFFFGVNCENGERVRMRYYPRNCYCGVNPHNSSYFVNGMYFLVGCRSIYPSVMELVAAFPLPELYMKDQEMREDEMLGDSVDSLLMDAQRRSGNKN